LIEGVYIRKLLVVGRRGVYDYYYKKTAIMQGVLLFLIFISMTTSLISRNNLVAIFGLFMIALSILFHIIFGRGK
jgi:hypothetical protein